MDQQPARQLIIPPVITRLLLPLFLILSVWATVLPDLHSETVISPSFLLPKNHLSLYSIEKYGSHVGEMRNELRYHKGVIHYSSIAEAEGLAALFIKSSPEEVSILNWPENSVSTLPQQQSYRYIQEKGHKKNQQITFNNTQAGKTHITGSYKFKPYTLETEEIVWSRQLIPLLMSSDLQQNPAITHNSFYIIDKGTIQKYTYTLESTENIEFENKAQPVLKFKINKDGSQRMSYAWLSKAHLYLPLKVEQYKNGDLNIRMLLTHLNLN